MMMTTKIQNYILDFTHVYMDEMLRKADDLNYIDCSNISGCSLYCTKEAEKEITRRIMPYGIHGIHFIDSGNYHYVTKIMLDQIQQKFSLVLYDHHTDMQEPMVEGMTSCGDWARQVLEQNENLKQLILVGAKEKDIKQLCLKHQEKLITFSAEELRTRKGKEKLKQIKTDVPFYISIDKDILDEQYMQTNWNQGHMSVEMLKYLLRFFLKDKRIIGVDLCGECQIGLPFPEYIEAEEKNGITNMELYEYIERYVER